MNMISYSQSDSNNNTMSSQKQKQFLRLLSTSSAIYGANAMKNSSTYYSQPKSYSGSNSSCSSSEADLDEITIVKEEPLSPHSSCPPSPHNSFGSTLPSISSINPDLMYDRKVILGLFLWWKFFYGFKNFLLSAILEKSRSALPYLFNLHNNITNQNRTSSV